MPQSKSLRSVLLLSLLYIWGNWGTGRLSDFPFSKWWSHCSNPGILAESLTWCCIAFSKRKLKEDKKRNLMLLIMITPFSLFLQRQELQVQHPSYYLEMFCVRWSPGRGASCIHHWKGTVPSWNQLCPHPGGSRPGLCSLLNAFDTLGSSAIINTT